MDRAPKADYMHYGFQMLLTLLEICYRGFLVKIHKSEHSYGRHQFKFYNNIVY